MRVDQAGISKDDWTGITERNERKKRRNRLNQRARRERKTKDEIQIIAGKKPYRVSRWRIQPPKEQSGVLLSNLASSPKSFDDNAAQAIVDTGDNATLEEESEILSALIKNSHFSPRTSYPTPLASVNSPLSSDHLIRLIHQNVFSALMNNK